MSVPAGGFTTFDVRYNPVAFGTHDAIVRIRSDDQTNPLYSFAIRGDGAAVPQIEVRGGTNGDIGISDGDASPSVGDLTDFGQIELTKSAKHAFAVFNLGSQPLHLTGTPQIKVTGEGAADFQIVNPQPLSPIAAGGQTTFQILFTPSARGQRRATVTILSDDPNHSSYTFDIIGTGI